MAEFELLGCPGPHWQLATLLRPCCYSCVVCFFMVYFSVPMQSSGTRVERGERGECYELQVLDAVLRSSADPFNRRLSETNLVDLRISNNTCSLDHIAHLSTTESEILQNEDNPFQNDKLPLWEGQGAIPAAPGIKVAKNTNSNLSSPDNNNYGGQQVAYKYRSLNETPSSPELANHRMKNHSPPCSPEIIQVSCDFSTVTIDFDWI